MDQKITYRPKQQVYESLYSTAILHTSFGNSGYFALLTMESYVIYCWQYFTECFFNGSALKVLSMELVPPKREMTDTSSA